MIQYLFRRLLQSFFSLLVISLLLFGLVSALPGGILPGGILPGGILPGGILPGGILPLVSKASAQGPPDRLLIPIGGGYSDIYAGFPSDASAQALTPTPAPTIIPATPASDASLADITATSQNISPTATPYVIPPAISRQYLYLMITLSALAVLVVFVGLLITRSYRR